MPFFEFLSQKSCSAVAVFVSQPRAHNIKTRTRTTLVEFVGKKLVFLQDEFPTKFFIGKFGTPLNLDSN